MQNTQYTMMLCAISICLIYLCLIFSFIPSFLLHKKIWKKDWKILWLFSGFSYTSGTSTFFIIFHYLPDHDSTFHHGNPFFFCGSKFRIIRMNCSCIDNKINIISNIFCWLTIYYVNTYMKETEQWLWRQIMYQIDLQKPCTVHFIGIGGISMRKYEKKVEVPEV